MKLYSCLSSYYQGSYNVMRFMFRNKHGVPEPWFLKKVEEGVNISELWFTRAFSDSRPQIRV